MAASLDCNFKRSQASNTAGNTRNKHAACADGGSLNTRLCHEQACACHWEPLSTTLDGGWMINCNHTCATPQGFSNPSQTVRHDTTGQHIHERA